MNISGSIVQNVVALGGDSGGGVLSFAGRGNTANHPVIGVNSARSMCDTIGGTRRCGAKTQLVNSNWRWGF